MGFDVAFVGQISFAKATGVQQWLAALADASGDTWPADMQGDGRAAAPVRAVLASLGDEARGAPLHLVVGEREAELRVLLHEDAFRDAGARVVRAFQLAGRCGGEGSLDLLGLLSSDLALRVTIARKILASASALRGLRRLSLALSEIADEGALALAASPHLAKLERLDLDRRNFIALPGATALAASPLLASLDTLTLDTNLFPADTALDAPPARVVCTQPLYRGDDEPGAADAGWSRDAGWRWSRAA